MLLLTINGRSLNSFAEKKVLLVWDSEIRVPINTNIVMHKFIIRICILMPNFLMWSNSICL